MDSTSADTSDEQQYRAIAAYEPVHGDEIKLIQGDYVIILHSYDDGWVLAKNKKSQAVGLLPRNFLVTRDSNHTVIGSALSASERRSSFVVRARNSVLSTCSTPYPKQQDINHQIKESTACMDALPSLSAAPSPPPEIDEPKKLEMASEKWAGMQKSLANRINVPANIGCLRISIVGDSGIGKTCFVQSLLSIDEITVAESLPQTDGSPSICEVRVSTIPTAELHPNEDQLNLTFIDTPGFGSIVDTLQVIRPVVDYHQQQFTRTDRVFTKDISSSHLQRFLRASTGPHTHTDVCIYGVLHRLTPVDIEFMKRLSLFVNIVPIILKCDTLKPEEVFKLKVQILTELAKHKISVYTFGMTHDELLTLAKGNIPRTPPFAVYSPNIVESNGGPRNGSGENEFEVLKDALFYKHIDDLRSLTAEKFCKWRTAPKN